MTETSTKEFHSSDLVYGLYTKLAPKSADEWLSRKRRYLWPPTNVTKLVDDGCFLVPTGSSYESETIWRLSFVQIEKEMVWTWSAMQYKCFMLLKLIKRNMLQTVLPDVISSYQLKTIMYWVSEETDPLFWKTNNIRECFTRCLKFLLECVQNENCPHYFVRTNNLFRGKLNKRLKEELISIFSRILQNFWTEVFKIPCLYKVSENLEEGEIECFADVLTATLRHPVLLNEMINLYFSVIMSLATSAMKPAFKFLRKNDIDIAIKRHHEYRLLIARFSLTDPEHLELEQLINRLIDISLGSQLNSKACKTENNIEKTKLIHEAEMLIKRGINLDTASGRLKLATLYFFLSTEGVFQLNGFEPQSPNISPAYALRIISEQPCLTSTLRDHGALELVFLPSEINSAPDPIKFEINRAVLAEHECSLDNPLSWATFDADFYALLLKFLILHKQNEYEERNATLSKLRESVKNNNSFYNRISAMNVVGYCLQLVGEVQWALDVFLGSLVLTGDKLDYIKDDSLDINNFAQTNLLPDEYKIDNCFNRYSCDKVVNGQGINLLDLSTSSSLRILNGRYIGDIMGNFTCMTSNGSSVVDYAIVSESLLSSVEYFKTHEFNYLSDHVKIEIFLKCMQREYNFDIFENSNWSSYKSFKWDSQKSKLKLLDHLSDETVLNNIVNFEMQTFSNDQRGVDDETNKLTTILCNLAENSCVIKIFLKLFKPKNKQPYLIKITDLKHQKMSNERLKGADKIAETLKVGYAKIRFGQKGQHLGTYLF
ncbi:unnamed protein product [Mytilus edulis]|uniref:Mab-21-like HhH/H2TH-like domain-containing protein n=1 Tax=Mytilus edulis TaxID=6550 RepID=A0A8S3PQV3_MYTED|nr:unnamed protein product [Mytilus edulis]